MFIWLEKRLSPNKSPRDKLMNSTIDYGFHLNDLKVKWKGDKLVAYKYLPLSTNPPRRHLKLGLDLEKWIPKSPLRFFANAFFRQCVISQSGYRENELAGPVLFLFLFLNIASAIYRKCDISHMRYIALAIYFVCLPLKKNNIKTFSNSS